MIDAHDAARFRRLGTLTIFAVYFVILVGGIVRASGAGMGCPDWPTCFGQWVPPTHESQLPANYHEIYAARGYESTAFNPVKTWTEYTNRLVGVTIGFLIFLTAWTSRVYLKADKAIFYLALSVFFTGWVSRLAGFGRGGKQPEAINDNPAHAAGPVYRCATHIRHCQIAKAIAASHRQSLADPAFCFGFKNCHGHDLAASSNGHPSQRSGRLHRS